LHEIRALIKEINGVKAEISKIGSFFVSDEELRVRKALKTKLENFFFQLGPNRQGKRKRLNFKVLKVSSSFFDLRVDF